MHNLWHARTDEEIVEAGIKLGEYSPEGQEAIRAELQRRGLPKPRENAIKHTQTSASNHTRSEGTLPRVSRTVVSGLLAFPIYLLLTFMVSFPFDYLHVITGNLLIVFCLYFLWRWKSARSFRGAFLFAVAAMPVAIVLYSATAALFYWVFPSVR